MYFYADSSMRGRVICAGACCCSRLRGIDVITYQSSKSGGRGRLVLLFPGGARLKVGSLGPEWVEVKCWPTQIMNTQENGGSEKRVYVTLRGLPLTFHLEWPFRKSTSGADFWVLHGNIRLESSAGLHAPVAVNLSATVRDVLPSLEPKDSEAPVINALRKEVDRRQIEFLPSGKLLPVHFSSRYYDFKRNRWVFGKASDQEILLQLKRKVFWQTQAGGERVWIADPAEALYLETPVEHLLEVATELAHEALIKMAGEYATAAPSLMEQNGAFQAERSAALKELEQKHAFERG
jgi:hypothetical protein